MTDFRATILIIDDSVKNLKLITHFLEDRGYETMTAQNGRDGLQKAARGKPDLILLDIMMPDMDGNEVCRRLQSIEHTRDIPIIFLTAKGATEDIVQGFRDGAVDYVLKPFQPEELAARVNTHIRLKNTIAALESALKEIKTLRRMLPICCICKKIRNDTGYWNQIESYITAHSETEFTHSICPDCARIHYPDIAVYPD